MTAASGIYLGILIIALVLLIYYYKSGRLLKCVLFTAFTGLLAFGAVYLASRFTGLPITLTPFSMAVSGMLGIPGVIAMLALNLF
jgi:inhibitor of the pro-sigma K processing machinery